MNQINNPLSNYSRDWGTLKQKYHGKIEGLLEFDIEEPREIEKETKPLREQLFKLNPIGSYSVNNFAKLKETLTYLEELAQLSPSEYHLPVDIKDLRNTQKKAVKAANNYGQQIVGLSFKNIFDTYTLLAANHDRDSNAFDYRMMKPILDDSLAISLDNLFLLMPKKQRANIRELAPKEIAAMLPEEQAGDVMWKIQESKKALKAYSKKRREDGCQAITNPFPSIQRKFAIFPGKLASEAKLEELRETVQEQEERIKEIKKELEKGPKNSLLSSDLFCLVYYKDMYEAVLKHQNEIKSLMKAS